MLHLTGQLTGKPVKHGNLLVNRWSGKSLQFSALLPRKVRGKRRGTNDVCNSDPHLLLSGTRNSSVLKSDFVLCTPSPYTAEVIRTIVPKCASLLNFIPEKARISAGRPSEQKSRLV